MEQIPFQGEMSPSDGDRLKEDFEKKIRRSERQIQALKHALIATLRILWVVHPSDRGQIQQILEAVQ